MGMVKGHSETGLLSYISYSVSVWVRFHVHFMYGMVKAPLTQDHEVYTTVHEVGVFQSV